MRSESSSDKAIGFNNACQSLYDDWERNKFFSFCKKKYGGIIQQPSSSKAADILSRSQNMLETQLNKELFRCE